VPIILVVDDEPQLRGWLRQILESKGYQVEEAADGDEAIDCVERIQPAVIVLDVYMAGKEGFETIIYLRSHIPSVRILAISGNEILGYDTCPIARVLGAHDVMAKPFSADAFLQRVEALLPHP
jgi:two-component system, response regulator, stage 0 sporulation protein F